MLIDDIFVSIQGESTLAGKPCTFIRTWGCPIGCVYCDQPQNKENARKSSVDDVMKLIEPYAWTKFFCLTGGEPLVQPKNEIIDLVTKLFKIGTVTIETSGCVPLIPEISDKCKYIMDFKLPSSGIYLKNHIPNLSLLTDKDEIKFVVADWEDYSLAKTMLEMYKPKGTILFSPMFDKNGKSVIGKKLADWILFDKLDARIQIQLHKIINVK